MTRDLLLGALDAGALEVIDEELVPPSAAAAGIGGPWRLPILPEACATR